MISDKEKLETNILKKVFSEEGVEIEKSEQPDFLLKYSTGNIIGVEITELYFDGTSARINNVGGYVSNLINHKKYIHKEDRKKLKVNEITYYPSKGNLTSVKMDALFLPNYSFADYRKAIVNRLKEKNKKSQKYNSTIQQCNLIINDRENKLNKVELREFSVKFFSEEVINEIRNSPFDEIYFITKVAGKEYYIHLKAFILINIAYSLRDYLINNKLIGKLQYLNMDFEDLYAEALLRYGYEKVRFEINDEIKIIYSGRYGIGINFHENNKWGFGIYDTYPLAMADNYGHFYSLADKKKKFFNEQKFNAFKEEYENKFISGLIGFKTLK